MTRKLGHLATSLALVVASIGITASSADAESTPPPGVLPPLPAKSYSKVSSSLSDLTSLNTPKLNGDGAAAIVEIKVATSAPSMVGEFIEKVGGRVTHVRGESVWADVPVDRITALAAIPEVSFLTRPPRGYPLGNVSQGVATTGVGQWHADGADGSGIRVAIVDLGFSGYQSAIGAGDLPGSVITKNYCGSGNFGGTVHGTGVAEIVHDMAPAAQIYLVCVSTEADLDKAVDFAIANGIDVINHSVGWWNTSRGDGSGGPGTPEGIANRAIDAGIVWVQASGNHADRHWKGKFVDTNGDTAHEFAPGNWANAFILGPGQTVGVFLKWDSWPKTSIDYDLYLYDFGDDTIVDGSENVQNGSQPPTEEIFYTNFSNSVMVLGAVITDFSNSGSTPRMDLFITSDQLQYQVKASSVVEPAGAPKVVTVGATCWSDDSFEDYSSRGPNIAGVIKPDVTAPTGVDSFAYGPGNPNCGAGFTGTSSSSPHVAGMAALILDTAPGLSPSAVKSRLMTHTIDLGAKGKDNKFGAGRINAFGLCDGDVPTIIGSGGKDKLIGTSKADVIHGYGAADTIDGKNGDDLICGGGGNDDLSGGKGKDEIRGETGDDLLAGGSANDDLIGGPGDDTVSYDDAPGKVVVDLDSGSSSGSQGRDALKSFSTVIGSDFDDVIHGSDGADVLEGGGGADRLVGRAGDDLLIGGTGADELLGVRGADEIKGGGGPDLADGGPGEDVLIGGSGDDHLIGADDADVLKGGGGVDFLQGGGGADILKGHKGDDELRGQDGHDVLDGGPGKDLLLGGPGPDRLIGGGGNDVIEGGGSEDTVVYKGAGGGVTVKLSKGKATGGWGADILSTIERIVGSLFDDLLTGDASPNVIDGGDGDDIVWGLAGDDTLIGGDGNDSAFGGSGADTCVAFENVSSC